jgi:hypothetical protein
MITLNLTNKQAKALLTHLKKTRNAQCLNKVQLGLELDLYVQKHEKERQDEQL